MDTTSLTSPNKPQELHPVTEPGGPKTIMSSLDKVQTKTEEGEIVDHGADTQLHRSLGTRHLTMVALGSAIGMGMWLGSGTSLLKGGPASLFIGYLISSSILWSVSQCIGEMAVVYPLPSAFVQWTTIFISPAAGFALGWGYWFSYWITIANELQVRIARL
jgi:amino acid transporter